MAITNLENLWITYCISIKMKYEFSFDDVVPEFEIDASLGASQEDLWAVKIDDRKVTIPKLDSYEHPFFKSIILREAFAHCLPKSVNDHRARLDIASEHVFHSLKGVAKKRWRRIWAKECPPIPIANGSVYRPQYLFDCLRKMSRKEGFRDLMARIRRVARHRVEMNLDDWANFLHNYVMNVSIPLAATEVKVIDALWRAPHMERKHIADYIGRSAEWTSEIINRLQKRFQLVEQENVAYSQIRIRVFHLTLTPESDASLDCSYLLRWCPFVFSIAPILSGVTGLYSILCVPDHHKNIELVEHMLAAAEADGIGHTFFERYESGNWLTLEDYDTRTGTWHVDWDSFGLEADMMQREGLASIYPDIKLSRPDDEIKLDNLDFKLLREFENGVRTTQELRKNLRVRTATVVERLNRLRNQNVIVKRWEVHHIGLNEEALLKSEDNQTARVVSALSLRIPRCFLDYDRVGRVFMRIKIPSGGAYGLSNSMRTITPSPEFHLIGRQIWGGWKLSEWLEDWDEATGRWKATLHDVSRWLESLEDGPYMISRDEQYEDY